MFVKLFQQILDSSIADDRKLRHFFTDLLLCADGEGYVIMTEMAIARRIGAPLEEVEWGLAELQKPDPISKTKAMQGRRIEPVLKSGYGWRIINYEHYRAMRDADQLREAVRLRVKRHRAKKAEDQQSKADGNDAVTRGNACNAMQKKRQSAEEEVEGEVKNRCREAEAKAFAVSLGLPSSDGESCFHKWEGNGWMNGNQKIKDWKATIRSWKASGYLPSQKQKPSATKSKFHDCL